MPFHQVGSDRNFVVGKGPGLAAEYLRRAALAELRPLRADFAVASSHFLADAAVVRAATRRGARAVGFVYHLIAARSDRSLRTRWSRADEALGLRLLRAAAATVFSSNAETIAELRRRRFAPIRTDVGVDLSAFQDANPASAAPIVLFVARLVEKKGILDVIEALHFVRQQVPGVRLIVAGIGPEQVAGAQRAAELGIDVEWRGFVTEEAKRALLASARVFAAPSYEEGWGISVAEAMASNLPVVAYRLPTLDEVFEDGYVAVQVGSKDELAASIAGLLTDDAAAATMAAKGKSIVAKYDVGAIADQELEAILAAPR